MLEMNSTSKPPPPISDMLHKFVLSFKTKTFEFFSDETTTPNNETTFSLLDSTEELFIPHQKLIILKPDPTHHPPTHFTQTFMSSLFASISSFEASYLQFQTAHVPVDPNSISLADRCLVSTIQKFTNLRHLYHNSRVNSSFDTDMLSGSCLESQVQENQSKLRVLETLVNQLQSEIDVKEDDVLALRKKLQETEKCNEMLSTKLKRSLVTEEVLCTIRVFDSMLRDACKLVHCFSKVLIGLMKKAGWDLDLAANGVYSGVEYVKKRHNCYAILSYVCLGMFKGFDSEDFSLSGVGIGCNCSVSLLGKNGSYLRQFIEHVSDNPMEFLNRNPNCEFSRFCKMKYEEIIHPTMASSIFSNLDRKEVVLDSWKSSSLFHELFAKMSSSIWLLHKFARSINPVVEIFQVKKGVDFSMVYMEDVTRKGVVPGKSKPKVGFTVVPGFKIGRTVIQSKVYLTGLKCTEE